MIGRYSHHHMSRLHGDVYRLKWPVLLADTQKILREVQRLGVDLCGPDGFGSPRLDSSAGIAFNGDAATGHQADPLRISGPLDYGRPVGCSGGICHTGGQPYDLAVTAVLLRAGQLLRGDFVVTNPGRLNTGPDCGMPLYGLPSARALVTGLFGDSR